MKIKKNHNDEHHHNMNHEKADNKSHEKHSSDNNENHDHSHMLKEYRNKFNISLIVTIVYVNTKLGQYIGANLGQFLTPNHSLVSLIR